MSNYATNTASNYFSDFTTINSAVGCAKSNPNMSAISSTTYVAYNATISSTYISTNCETVQTTIGIPKCVAFQATNYIADKSTVCKTD